MSAKLTAEQVKFRLRELAERDELGLRTANAAYEHAGDIVRDNLIESTDERRKRFERWHRDRFGDDAEGLELLEKDRDGGYESVIANAMWLAFNAALDFGGGGGE